MNVIILSTFTKVHLLTYQQRRSTSFTNTKKPTIRGTQPGQVHHRRNHFIVSCFCASVMVSWISSSFRLISRSNSSYAALAESERAKNKLKTYKTKVVAITDSETSPLTRYANHTLIARSDIASFVDSLVAPLSVINALIVAIVMRNKESAAATFESLEDIWAKYNAYRNTDEN